MLLSMGCASPRAQREIEARRQELKELELQVKDLAAVVPIVAERKQRIKALQAENEQLKAEIARLKQRP